eukprot:240387-Amphidinium_carterae.1
MPQHFIEMYATTTTTMSSKVEARQVNHEAVEKTQHEDIRVSSRYVTQAWRQHKDCWYPEQGCLLMRPRPSPLEVTMPFRSANISWQSVQGRKEPMLCISEREYSPRPVVGQVQKGAPSATQLRVTILLAQLVFEGALHLDIL